MTDRLSLDRAEASGFLKRMYPDGSGCIGLSSSDSAGGNLTSKVFDTVSSAVAWAAAQDVAGARDVYFRTTTLVSPERMVGRRGTAADSYAVTLLAADLDFGVVGHQPSPNGVPLPATAEDAMKMISELPEPTLIVHSGGGLYPIWQVDVPVRITDENRAQVAAMSDRWQKIIEATAQSLGWHYGNVGDLPRLLRLPGSLNRKVAEERRCQVIEDTGIVYPWAELVATVERLTEAPTTTPPPALGGGAMGGSSSTAVSWIEVSEPGPFDALADHADWADVLPGWERVACPDSATLEAWRRPGATHPVSAKVLKVEPHVLVVHSTDAGLPSGAGQRLTKGRVYSHLNYGGDPSAAASALRNGTAVNLPPGIVAAVATPPAAPPATSATTTTPAVEQTAEEAADWHRRAVAAELRQLRVRVEARAILDAETRPGESADLDAEYLTVNQLADLPKLAPLIDGVLSRGTYAVLRGRDSTFKSFVALDWALCLATGKAWQGRPAERAKVLYIAGEGVYGIAERVRAWEYAWGVKVDPEWFTVRKSAVNLFRPGPAFEDLLVRVGGYGCAVLDTLRRHAGGADGNSTDMGIVVDNIDRIKRATGDGTVLVLAHTDKSDTDSRGYSGIEDDADTVWHARRDGMRVELECTKQKDGPDHFKVQLEMHRSGDSLIVSAGAQAQSDEDGTAEQIVMMAMSGMFGQTGATATEVIEATGLAKTSFYRARGKLLGSGRLISVGTKSRSRLEMP